MTLAQMITAVEQAVNGERFDREALIQTVKVLRWQLRYYEDLKPLALVFAAFPGSEKTLETLE